MDYRALTITREFGSGGAGIARILAKELGWKLLDRELIENIAYTAHVDTDVVKHHDECIESMLTRMKQNAVRAGAAVSIGVVIKDNFDDKRMAELTRQIIKQAYENCQCVIVGRGAQCILRSRPDVFHVYVYAPLADRIRRVRERSGMDENEAERRIHTVDAERTHYLKRIFGENWREPNLYNLLISSHAGEEKAARVIRCAMTGQ